MESEPDIARARAPIATPPLLRSECGKDLQAAPPALGVGLKRSARQRAISRGLVAVHLLPHIGVAHEWDKPGIAGGGGVGKPAAREASNNQAPPHA